MLNHDKIIFVWGCFTAWWYVKNLLLKDLANRVNICTFCLDCSFYFEDIEPVTMFGDKPRIFKQDKSNKITCAPSEDTDQPGHSLSFTLWSESSLSAWRNLRPYLPIAISRSFSAFPRTFAKSCGEYFPRKKLFLFFSAFFFFAQREFRGETRKRPFWGTDLYCQGCYSKHIYICISYVFVHSCLQGSTSKKRC